MNSTDTQEYGEFLRTLTAEQIDRLLSNILKELRRRDSDRVKGDVLANTKALWRLRAD
jgi:hypothetical protein